MRIEQRKFSQSHVSIIARSSSHSGTKSSFRIETEGLGYFDVNDSVGTMSYEYPSFLGTLMGLWDLYSLVFHFQPKYAVSDSKSGEIIKKGMAFAHMEKNWGNVRLNTHHANDI
eukprot:jgi/Bigna1/146097/aug1.108_g20805